MRFYVLGLMLMLGACGDESVSDLNVQEETSTDMSHPDCKHDLAVDLGADLWAGKLSDRLRAYVRKLRKNEALVYAPLEEKLQDTIEIALLPHPMPKPHPDMLTLSAVVQKEDLDSDSFLFYVHRVGGYAGFNDYAGPFEFSVPQLCARSSRE